MFQRPQTGRLSFRGWTKMKFASSGPTLRRPWLAVEIGWQQQAAHPSPMRAHRGPPQRSQWGDSWDVTNQAQLWQMLLDNCFMSSSEVGPCHKYGALQDHSPVLGSEEFQTKWTGFQESPKRPRSPCVLIYPRSTYVSLQSLYKPG